MPNDELKIKNTQISDMLLEDRHKLAELLNSLNVALFEYFIEEDTLITYNTDLTVRWKCGNYLADLPHHSRIWKEDLPLMRELLQNADAAPVEMRVAGEDGQIQYYVMSLATGAEESEQTGALLGTVKNVTHEKEHELALREKASRDSLTMLYNRGYGQKIVNDYLYGKGPFVSCALLVIDIDFFKQVNDTYGHLFGDTVLVAMAQLLRDAFDIDDIVIRAGGDEFAVFVKNVSYTSLIHKTATMLENVRKLQFAGRECRVTCSVGVCFLPENTFGYTYQQLFGDADWALYRAKKFGRDRYEFCDNLQRYASALHVAQQPDSDIDERYMRNDVISTAFEIFDKTPGFDAAIALLLKVVGLRLQLDRITVIRTDTHERKISRSYQWTAQGVGEALETGASFTQDDFLTLFNSYDSYGTTVLNYDDMDAYSDGARELLMQGDAKTVVYAAMYCEGHYAGAVSYVTCESKRHWSQNQRCQLGELTKIISAHLVKSQALNFAQDAAMCAPDFDSLTGLMSFPRFREETERVIVGNRDVEYVMVYSDFENFKYFNRKYGYKQGDHLLKRFASHVAKTLVGDTTAYFSRIAGDQFVLFMPCEHREGLDSAVDAINTRFVQKYSVRFPDAALRVRSGIYCVEPACGSSSEAIDAANYARQHVKQGAGLSACVYTKQLKQRQQLENDIVNGMADALKNDEFVVYLQPKFSIADRSIVGAEALVRWHRPDGTVLQPGDFVPIYERSGRITELDFYVFEKVAAFLARNNKLRRRQVPISINASILHTADIGTVQHYIEILKKYDVDPALTEIELTETATVAEHDSVVRLFEQLQGVGIMTSLDDFGAGYSVLNAVIDIPVNTIKIDKLLLNCCENNERGAYFLKQIITMVKGLGYHVLCEGIENESQLELLRDAGCEIGQGYLFSKPVTVEEYEKLLYGSEA